MSNDKSSIWHLVIFESPDVSRSSVVDYCQKQPAVKLCAREATDENMRPHYHIAHMYDEPTCRSVVRERLKKFFPGLNGKKDYNLHLPKTEFEDLQGLYRYICKGTKESPPDIVYNLGEFIDTAKYREDYYTAQDNFKSSVKTHAEKIQKEKMKKRNECLAEARLRTFSNRLEIVSFVYSYLEGNIATHDLTIMVQRIEFRQDPDASINLMYNIVNKKLSPF